MPALNHFNWNPLLINWLINKSDMTHQKIIVTHDGKQGQNIEKNSKGPWYQLFPLRMRTVDNSAPPKSFNSRRVLTYVLAACSNFSILSTWSCIGSCGMILPSSPRGSWTCIKIRRILVRIWLRALMRLHEIEVSYRHITNGLRNNRQWSDVVISPFSSLEIVSMNGPDHGHHQL